LAAPPVGGAARHQRGAKSALAAADRRHAGVITATTSTPSRSRYATRRTAGFQRSVFAVPVGSRVSLRAAIGEHGLRRRPSRWAVICRRAGERPQGRARVAGTHRADGATAGINPGWSRPPLNVGGSWNLGPADQRLCSLHQLRDRAAVGWQGAATHEDLLVGAGGTHERSRDHSKEGSSAARCTSRSARPSNPWTLRGRSPRGG
jgi:hypothetical protein